MSTKMIPIKVFSTPAGAPTCALNITKGYMCRFLGTRALGTIDVCMATSEDLNRSDGGEGWLVPSKRCPVYNEE